MSAGERPGVWEDAGPVIELPDHRVRVELLERRIGDDGELGNFEIMATRTPQVPAVGHRIAFKNGAVYEVVEVTWWPEYEWTVEVVVREVEASIR